MSSNTFIEQQQVPIQALLPEVPKPKRPRTSYNLFFKSEQEKLQRLILEGKCSIKRSNIANVISESWKKITPSVRLHYDQLAAEDKFRYMNERIEYKSYLERRRAHDKRVHNKASTTTPPEQRIQTGVPKLTSRRKLSAVSPMAPPATTATSNQNGANVALPSHTTSLASAFRLGRAPPPAALHRRGPALGPREPLAARRPELDHSA